MKALKKSIVACGVTLVMCVSLLLGTTFAWFTDSITNEGNRIQSGSLKIDAYAYDLGEGGVSVSIDGAPEDTYTFAADGQNLKTDTAPIISGTLAPGGSSAKLLNVSNAGSLTAKVKLDFEIVSETNNISDVLWFDFIGITVDGNTATAVTGEFTEREMSQLAELSEREFELAPEAGMWYVFVYGMKGAEAGNEYQRGEFELDVTILAKQAVDGAEYATSVASSEALTEAISEGGNISLDGDMDLNLEANEQGTGENVITQDTTIDLNGHTLTNDAMLASIQPAAGVSLTIENGSLDFRVTENWNVAHAYISVRQEGSELVVRNCDVVSYQSFAVIETPGNTRITIEDSDIFCANSVAISTNATKSYPCEIVIRNSTIECGASESDGYQAYENDNCAVWLNVAGRLTIENSTIIGQRQGVMVRGGEANISNTTIICKGEYSDFTTNDKYVNGGWSTGNEVPMAALVVGDRNESFYRYSASVIVTGGSIISENPRVPAIYIWGEDAYSATLKHAATTITGEIRGGGNNTVNEAAVTDNKPLS